MIDVYLACPYSHPDPAVMAYRAAEATRAAGMLMRRGLVVYSPITHGHAVQMITDLPRTWEFWKRADFPFLHMSRKLIVLTLDGWQESVGVGAELAEAKRMDMPISYLGIVELQL